MKYEPGLSLSITDALTRPLVSAFSARWTLNTSLFAATSAGELASRIGTAWFATSSLPVAKRRLHTTIGMRSEEHTSELQSPYDLVCRLLLEKKNKTQAQTRP